jgi:large subunit ribosomal protein L25
MKIEINARKREAQGTGASRRLRRLGSVPGIVYGGDEAFQREGDSILLWSVL